MIEVISAFCVVCALGNVGIVGINLWLNRDNIEYLRRRRRADRQRG